MDRVPDFESQRIGNPPRVRENTNTAHVYGGESVPVNHQDYRIMQVINGTYRQVYNGFLMDRTTRGLSPRTIESYKENLKLFFQYLDQQGVVSINDITPEVLRMYLLELSTHRNKGGVHIVYRCIRAYLNWWEFESDGEFKNPIKKIKLPAVNIQPLEPANLDNIRAILALANDRDKAIILTLLDTGIRANELIHIQHTDIDPIVGSIIIQHGKGDKQRMVYLGRNARRAIRKLPITGKYLFTNTFGDKLAYNGLREIIRRLCERAGIGMISLHSFRRAFALQMLRAGENIYTIQRLLGHSSLQILQRYIKVNDEDIQSAHERSSPGDSL